MEARFLVLTYCAERKRIEISEIDRGLLVISREPETLHDFVKNFSRHVKTDQGVLRFLDTTL